MGKRNDSSWETIRKNIGISNIALRQSAAWMIKIILNSSHLEDVKLRDSQNALESKYVLLSNLIIKSVWQDSVT